jgi:hypothetical protein
MFYRGGPYRLDVPPARPGAVTGDRDRAAEAFGFRRIAASRRA